MNSTHDKAYPVVEIFGPTIQGEGPYQGESAVFVRFGGCDFKCSWCDTPHAVLPEYVRQARRMAPEGIIAAAARVSRDVRWLVLTGGNPALHDLTRVVVSAQRVGYRVAVETQGTRWQDWLSLVDSLCISPKPPSAGMGVEFRDLPVLNRARTSSPGRAFVKVPIFTDEDLEWCKKLVYAYPFLDHYVTAGNDAGKTVAQPARVDNRNTSQVRDDLCDKYRWLVERVLEDPILRRKVRVQLQTHVLAWGNAIGR